MSDWDIPESRHPERDHRSGRVSGRTPYDARRARLATTAARRDGMMSPIAFFRFLLANAVKIGVITAVLTIAGLVLISLVPFPYRATATVLVDPRNEQVTLQEDVLSPIGSDAAILESMVQIMKSDGFLLTVMSKLGMTGSVENKLSEQEQLKLLAEFKKNLSVERKGATYLVEVSYKSGSAEEAARIANSVANSFAETQNGYLSDATTNAARALSRRLVELRAKLNASEKSVADFAAARGILYIDNQSTTLQRRQLTELSAQLALARSATEEARARYQEQVEANKTGVVLSNNSDVEPEQLRFLRQQRTQLMQALEQQSLTYGPRHPRIAETRQLLAGIERQIGDERALVTRQLKGAMDVAASQQAKLEADIAKLSSGVVLSDADEVQLEALRREAAADRDIYEKFLSRNKATDELAELKSENVRVVSPAVPPLRSSRPSLTLVAPVLGLLSASVATAMVVVAGGVGAAGGIGFRRRRTAASAKSDTVPQVAVAEPGESKDEPEKDSERAERRRSSAASLLSIASQAEPQPISRRRPTTSLLMMKGAPDGQDLSPRLARLRSGL